MCGISKFSSEHELRNLNLLKIFDEQNIELSHGEWQKLAIARALYNNCPILILDEPTSALDIKSASLIYDNILSFEIENKLVLFISHKPENYHRASKILFLKDGRVSGFSSHEDLLDNNSLYRRFLKSENPTVREWRARDV